MIKARLRRMAEYWTPYAGRLTRSQLTEFAETVSPPGFVTLGPLVLFFGLPESLRAYEPPPTLAEINMFLQREKAKSAQSE